MDPVLSSYACITVKCSPTLGLTLSVNRLLLKCQVARLCTDLNVDPVQIVKWFVMRWQLEVTLREVRTHLGVETQRQWSEWAIARTTPALLGLFSLVTLLAHCSTHRGKLPIRQAAWYVKSWPTFSDALAVVRHQLWQAMSFHTAVPETEMQKVPRVLLKRFTDALCYAT